VTVNLAIIGCGAATERYYIPALKKISSMIGNLYLVDKNSGQAQKTLAALGKGLVFDDYRQIINKVQGAVIVVPHFLHHSISMDFLRSGVNVLCEKPLSEDAHQAREMVIAAERNNAILCVNNTRRMFPSFKKIQEIINQGLIGKIKTVEYIEGSTFGWASNTGFYADPTVSSKGILLDLGSHVIDTICWWLGKKPLLREFKDDSFGGPESTAQIRAEADGCEISIFLNRLIDLDSRYKITGENGFIEGKPTEWNHFQFGSFNGEVNTIHLSAISKNYPGFVFPIFENFINILKGNAHPLVKGADVLHSVEFIDECYSHRTRFAMPEYDGIAKYESPREGKVLVTGASGFIGGRLVEILHLSKAHNVKAAINHWSNAARLGRFPVEIVQMDLMNIDTIEKALQDVTEVVHCAKGPNEVTVQGTRNLLEASLRNGIKQFVHLSTTEVYGNVTDEIDENAPLQYTDNAYNRMKVDAEKVCLEYIGKGLAITILRPSIVYGPFSKNWTINFANLMLAQKWAILNGIGEGKCNLIYIDDLVQAILLSLDNKKASGEVLNIVGPDIITWNEYFQNFNEALGLLPLKRVVKTKANIRTKLMQPIRLLGGFAQNHCMGLLKMLSENIEWADMIMRGTISALKSTPHPDELKLYSKSVLFSNCKAKEMLNYVPEIDPKTGLSRSVEWLKLNGLLTKPVKTL